MALSPMMEHYHLIKAKYKDCIVFYRLGDFYEMFYEDAIKASALLELTLTGRDCGLEERAPMCGVPYHACDEYISKLVSLGEKVAICEQLTKPGENGKKIVERDVVKVVTAGTVTNSELLDDNLNNFLCSVYVFDNGTSLSWVDITTGEFYAKKIIGDDYLSALFNEIAIINPVEIIANQKGLEILNNSPFVTQHVFPKAQSVAESQFSFSSSLSTLLEQFKVLSLAQFGIEDSDYTVCSAGALISYLRDTQKTYLSNITTIKVIDKNKFMMLDYNTIRNLELIKSLKDGKTYGSLYWVLDKTVTKMGARKLQNWLLSPLNSVEAINYRLEPVEFFVNNNQLRDSLKDLLRHVKDVFRLTGKLSNNKLMPKDAIALAKSLEVLPAIKFQLSGSSCRFIKDIISNLKDFSSLIDLIKNSIYDDANILYDENKKPSKNQVVRYIKEGYDENLDRYRNLFTNGKNEILKIERIERERTGIKNLKISYNRVFGYYIEITNSFKDKIPYDYIRKQTLTNAERFVTDQLKNLENDILNAEDKFINLELQLYNAVKEQMFSYIDNLQITSDALANLDVLLSFATVSKNNDYAKPNVISSENKLLIKEGRHPVVEKASKQRFIPNDCELDSNDNLINIITGPNMAGKSTYMRQNALIVIMAHVGCFVPAKSADIPLIDRVFTRIGASDNLIFNQSTFMVEMGEMATILSQATENSFLILDEIGRGTSTFDGLSIAWSIIEEIANNLRAKTLFATHYHELTELEGRINGVKNYKITVKEYNGTIIFLRKILRGGTNRSFGIEVAELAGISKSVTDRAKQILKRLESTDITKNNTDTILEKQTYNKTESIIKDLDVNSMSPMQAFMILCELHEKLKEENE